MQIKAIKLQNRIALVKSGHLVWLDQVRGMAALYVVCHHAIMQVIVNGDHAHDVFYRILQISTMYGHYAVDIFIVLSGYCLMLPVLKRQQFGSISLFYLRRTIRIVLPYFVALLFSLILIYWLIGSNNDTHWASIALPISLGVVIKHVLLIHQWFPSAALKINPAFWSVGVEYQIYFLFPLLYWGAKKMGFGRFFIFVTLLSYGVWAITLYLNVLNPSSTGTSLYYCALFYMGMYAAHLSRHAQTKQFINKDWVTKYSNKLSLLFILSLFSVAAINFILGRLAFSAYFPLQIQSFFVGLFFSIWLYLKSTLNTNMLSINNIILENTLQKLGTMGFSIYLLHDPILAAMWQYIVLPLHLHAYWMQALVELTFGMLASIAIASVFYKWVELPCHRISQNIK